MQLKQMKNSSVASNGLFLSSDKYVLVNFPHQIFFNKNFNFFKRFGAFIVKKLPKKKTDFAKYLFIHLKMRSKKFYGKCVAVEHHNPSWMGSKR